VCERSDIQFSQERTNEFHVECYRFVIELFFFWCKTAKQEKKEWGFFLAK
jgi:hypothetical protein